MPRGSSTSELQKKRKKNPLVGQKNNKVTAGEQYKTSVRNKNVSKVNKGESLKIKSKSKYIKDPKKGGRMVLASSLRGKQIMKKKKK